MERFIHRRYVVSAGVFGISEDSTTSHWLMQKDTFSNMAPMPVLAVGLGRLNTASTVGCCQESKMEPNEALLERNREQGRDIRPL